MRTLAIGDIHGCHRSLVALEAFARIAPDDLVITLGDHVDRGPDSKAVVEWLMRRHATGWLIALRGNHELMLLAAQTSAAAHAEWLDCGGDAVLASYGVTHATGLPRSHLEFLATRLRSYALGPAHFFVHANAYPDAPLEDQPEFMVYWEPFGRPGPHESGLTMVCGHTPQGSGRPLNLGHAVCIDNGGGIRRMADLPGRGHGLLLAGERTGQHPRLLAGRGLNRPAFRASPRGSQERQSPYGSRNEVMHIDGQVPRRKPLAGIAFTRIEPKLRCRCLLHQLDQKRVVGEDKRKPGHVLPTHLDVEAR